MKKKRKFIINFLIFSILGLLLIVKLFVADFYKIPQNGMYPTIPSMKRFLCRKNPYDDITEIKRGDIIAFKKEWRDVKDYNFIWRVIGLPGDEIKINDDNIVINDQQLKKEKIHEEEDLNIYLETNCDISYKVAYLKTRNTDNATEILHNVPENHVFVLGDNRDDAVDSRFIGSIPFDSIFAKKW